MFVNYLKIAWRNLLRHKRFSLINILGLSIGLAACLLIYGYVHLETSYDGYHPLKDRIARVTMVIHTPGPELAFANSPVPLAGTLVREFPEVQAAVRIAPGGVILHRGTEVFKEDNFVYSESSAFSIFSFSFLEGSAADALSNPYSIVLTRSIANKYFGDKEALGQILNCDKHDYRVTAVIADRPANSDIKIDALLSKDFAKITDWMGNGQDVYTFVLFRRKPDLAKFDVRLEGLAARYMQPDLERQSSKEFHARFLSEALADVHFSKGKYEDTPKGNRLFNNIFSGLAVFILVIALLNYINLSTAKATERAKEVGVRKVAGARPVQLIRQFLGESVLLMAIAWLLAVGLALAAIPFFNRLLSTHISLAGAEPILFLALVFPLTALLAGIYPAFVLSGFNPVRALKGGVIAGKGIGLRRVLTVVQFVIALAMLTGTVVIYSQMRYIMHRDLGADRAQIATLELPNDSVARRGTEAFCRALRQEPGVRGLSVGSGMPTDGFMMSTTTVFSRGRKKETLVNYFFIDPQFLSLLHIPLAEGRNFSDSLATDKKEGFLVNEAFVRAMGWKSAVGQSIEGDGRKGKVVGVVKDFFFKSLHNIIEPMVMVYTETPPLSVLVKVDPAALPRLKEIWKNYFPTEPTSYYFMDEQFDKQYNQDRLTMSLFNGFTLLAVAISCLGLYGLVSLITLKRMKEIGIRKVLGATIPGLLSLLSTDIWKLIGWASLVALPAAGWGLHSWLSTYAYHISLQAWMFILPVVLIGVIAGIFTGWRIVRAALANPVESLRTQ